MSKVQQALETARHELTVQNGLRFCDCPDCTRPTMIAEMGEVIKLIDEALEELSPSAN